MTKLAPEWVRTSDPVIRSPARYHWTTAPAPFCATSVTKIVFFTRPVLKTPIFRLVPVPKTPRFGFARA